MAAGATGLIAAGIVVLSQSAAANPHPRLTEHQILRMALELAARGGDPRPTLIQHSEGPHGKANQLTSGAYFGGSAWSYLIAERGKFIGYDATVPYGAALPRGTVQTLIVNASTGKVTDGGLTYSYPPLAQLGPVTTDFRGYTSCPADGRKQLTSTATGASARLVPGDATQVLLCRYQGLNPKPSALGRLLVHHLVTSSPTVQRLAREFDALPQGPSGSVSCPADFGVKILAIFRYPPAVSSDDPVALDPGGCAPVTNGRVARTAALGPGPKLIGQLAGLTEMAVLDAR